MSNFASGQQSQAELSLYFRVCILQKFYQGRHRDGRFAFGGYSLRAGCSGLYIEAFFKLFPKFHTRGLLDMGVGVHQHICRSVTRCALYSLHIAAGDHQLVGRTGMPQAVEHDAGELRVCILPLEELLTNQHRLDCQTVGQTEQHSAVTVAFRVFCFVRCHLPQPLLQLFFQSRGHEDRAAGRCGLGAFQDERSGAALQLVRENLDDPLMF